MYKKIVVGTDLSATAEGAVRRAGDLSRSLGAELFLVHAGTDPGAPLQQLAEEHGAEAVIVAGNPAEVLLSESHRLQADLLVVGSVGMSGARRFMLGNVPNKVSHHADRDLLIVKTDAEKVREGSYRSVLVGTDGSATAMRAVEMASSLSKQLGAAVSIVTVYEPPSEHELEQLRSGGSDAISAWTADKRQRETPAEFQWRIAGAAQAEDILDRAFERAAKHGLEPEVRAVEGAPAHTLLELAEKEDFELIAVGSVGMTGRQRFMLGNVPHRLSHHTPTDILILHTA